LPPRSPAKSVTASRRWKNNRRRHEICGIAPALGFAATGKAARSAETVMREAAHAKRALTPAEIGTLTGKLVAPRKAVGDELRKFSERN
jgi:hypothetical protein